MITGVGIDIIELKRIGELNQRKAVFKQRILTLEELEQYEELNTRLTRHHRSGERRSIEYLAGRFAAKEAFAKALGTGIGGACTWHDIAILSRKQGPPRVVWRKQPKHTRVHLSISHSETYAVAQAIIEEFSSSMSS